MPCAEDPDGATHDTGHPGNRESSWTDDERQVLLRQVLGQGSEKAWTEPTGQAPHGNRRRWVFGCLVTFILGLALFSSLDSVDSYCRLCGRRREALQLAAPWGGSVTISDRTEATSLSRILEPLYSQRHEHMWVVDDPAGGFGSIWGRLRSLDHGLYRTQEYLMMGYSQYFDVLRWLAKYDPPLALAAAEGLLTPAGWDEESKRLDTLSQRYDWFSSASIDIVSVWAPGPEELEAARQEHGLPPMPLALLEKLDVAREATRRKFPGAYGPEE